MDEDKQEILFDLGETKPIQPPPELPPEPKVEEPDRTQPMEFSPPLAGATISPCGKYRYTLWRRFKEQREGEKHILFIGANPSTADALSDDPTVRRLIHFAKRENAAIMTVCNVFAFRATDPKEMRKADDPFGRENGHFVSLAAQSADVVVCMWGNTGGFKHGGRRLRFEIEGATPCSKPILCFGVTKRGHPRHVLYISNASKLIPFEYDPEGEQDLERSMETYAEDF